jgi:hypothetical protein
VSARIDWEAFRDFAVRNLQPDTLLAGLRQQRRDRPTDPWYHQYFWRFREGDADWEDIDERIDSIRADRQVAAAIVRIEAYGFQVRISTYDEYNRKDLYVGMQQDLAAEERMCTSESLT